MIQHLSPSNYFVSQTGNLCNNIEGYSFVLFSSPSCHFCAELFPAFTKLSQIIKGCVFGLMNIEQEGQRIVAISNRSKTPLEYVPYIVLYGNGVPISQYHSDESAPDSNFEKMRLFLLTQTGKNQRNTPDSKSIGTAADKTSTNGTNSVIPPYSIGIPGNSVPFRSKRVCYLAYEKAYGKDK